MFAGKPCRVLWAWVLCLVALQPLAAEVSAPRPLTADEAPRWRGVGALQVAGKPTCSAVLISDHEAITAAHCVVDRASGHRVDPQDFTLVLGQDVGGFAAVRKVAATAFPPAYVTIRSVLDLGDLSTDLALLVLAPPVTPDEAAPLAVANWPQPMGDFVDIVGYERDGPGSASLREGCTVVQAEGGVAVVTCDVIAGISGAPVLLQARPDDPPRVVATVSSRGQGLAYVVAIAPRLAELRALIATQADQ